MSNLFEKKEILALATAELNRIKDFVESNGVVIDAPIESFGEFVTNNASNEVESAETLSTATLEENLQYTVCAVDMYVAGKSELRDKIVSYLQGTASENPLEKLTAELTLVVADEQDIINAVTALIDINGATTTLEVKTFLRNKGFKIDQETVHKALNEMYNKNYLSFTMKTETIPGKAQPVQFRNYTEGSDYYLVDQIGFVAVADDDDDASTDSTNATVNPVITSTTPTDLADLASAQYATLSERNRAMQTAKNYGHTTKAIAEAFGMSDRNARKIITGK